MNTGGGGGGGGEGGGRDQRRRVHGEHEQLLGQSLSQGEGAVTHQR